VWKRTLPPKVATYPMSICYRHLEKYHGISAHIASNRLHKSKEDNGLRLILILLIRSELEMVYRSTIGTYLERLNSVARQREKEMVASSSQEKISSIYSDYAL